MAAVMFQIQNVNKVETFLRELPAKIDRNLTRTNSDFMKSVRVSARRRVPKDTGSLKEDIVLEPVRRGKNVKKWKLVVRNPYAAFQEHGFTPHRFFAGPNINSSKLAPGKTYFVKKWTPFIDPALRHNLKTFPSKLNNAMRRSIK